MKWRQRTLQEDLEDALYIRGACITVLPAGCSSEVIL